LKQHLYVHATEKPYSCSVCKKQFCGRKSLKYHVNSHIHRSDEENLTHTNLSNHNENGAHLPDKKPYVCIFCKKSYISASKLMYHIRVHSGDKPFGCSVCAKTFASVRNLKKHRKTHGEKEKPHSCSLCPKSYGLPSELRTHTLRAHSEEEPEKPHRCHVCDKSYFTIRDLQIHTRVHTGEKPYVCELCAKSFHNLKNLRLHKIVHTGSRPFGCPVCKKSFSRSDNCLQHLRRVHGKGEVQPAVFSGGEDLGLSNHSGSGSRAGSDPDTKPRKKRGIIGP
jgi:uncharacterized Zn-finger protein